MLLCRRKDLSGRPAAVRSSSVAASDRGGAAHLTDAAALSRALDYSERHRERALIVAGAGGTTHERYDASFGPDRPHALYSGTKSFWGVLAVAAEDDGLLALDEPVGATIAEWRDDAQRNGVTLRQLLNLTSGLPFGGLGMAVPTYERALATPLRDAPGTTFRYGGIPLQVFGAVLARKLSARGLTPHAYLRERLLDPLGVRIASWRALADGTQPLPTGAFLTAMQWLNYGRFILRGSSAEDGDVVASQSLARCFEGSDANPRYGLGFWLHGVGGGRVPYASGSGGQALYIVPGASLAIVRFGEKASFKHETFLARLLG